MIITKDGSHLIDPDGDFFKTLEACQGHYDCPTRADGSPLGQLVGYAGTYPTGRFDQKGKEVEEKYVGFAYYNFSMADIWPAVLTFYAEAMVKKLQCRRMNPDVIIGGPWAGVKFAQEVSRLVGCRNLFGEKVPLEIGEDGKVREELAILRYDGCIFPGDHVLICEELVNNASTTEKLIRLIEKAGGIVDGIICAINRSYPFRDSFTKDDGVVIPIIGVMERETPQYRQDDPLITQAIASGNVVWKPKHAWKVMKETMDKYR